MTVKPLHGVVETNAYLAAAIDAGMEEHERIAVVDLVDQDLG